jgi:hypothetical protein
LREVTLKEAIKNEYRTSNGNDTPVRRVINERAGFNGERRTGSYAKTDWARTIAANQKQNPRMTMIGGVPVKPSDSATITTALTSGYIN